MVIFHMSEWTRERYMCIGTQIKAQDCMCNSVLSLLIIKTSTSPSSDHFWLRDHCRCAECFHQITKQRLVNTFEACPNLNMGVCMKY